MSYILLLAAKLGRRSHKMREMICEASRTIEDSGTAQALHGLLSLKSLESSTSSNEFPNLMRAIGGQSQKGDDFALTGLELDAASGISDSPSNQSAEALSNRLGSPAAFLPDVLKDRSAASTSRTGAVPPGGSLSLVVRVPTGQDQLSAQKTKTIKPKVALDRIPQTPLSGAAVTLGRGRERLTTSGGDQVLTGIQLPLLSARSPAVVGGEGQYHVVLVTPSGTTTAAQSPVGAGPQADVSKGFPLQLIATSQGLLAIPQNIHLQQLTRQPSSTATPVLSRPLAPSQSTTPIVVAQSTTAAKKQNQPGWPLSIVAGPRAEPTTALSTKRRISAATGEQNHNGAKSAKIPRSVLSVVTSGSKSGGFVSDARNLSQQQIVLQGPSPAAIHGTGVVGYDSGKRDTFAPVIVDVKGGQLNFKHLVSMLPKLVAAASTATASDQSQTNTPALSAQLLSNNILIQQSADSSLSVDLLALAAESSGCQPSGADIVESMRGLNDIVDKKEVRLMTQIEEGFEKSFSKLQTHNQLKFDSNGTREVRHLPYLD